METPKITESEYRFCRILWENEPIKSKELVRLCGERLDWKETTTYTVIKRLSERGVVKNEKTIVTSLYTKDEIQTAQMEELLEKTFEGSLPDFVAAFAKSQNLTEAEWNLLQSLIGRCRKENDHG